MLFVDPPRRADTFGSKRKSMRCFFRRAQKNQALTSLAFLNGAVEKTRTSTSCDTATSTLRVYQFRHDRIVVGATPSGPAPGI